MTAVAAPPPVAPLLALDAQSGPLSRISADLLPDEVRARRRLGHLKRRLVFGFVALALVIGLGYTLVREQTSKAEDSLATAQLRNRALSNQATRYGTVVGIQGQTQQITSLLTKAMAGDVPWATLFARMQQLAPRGLVLTGIDASAGVSNAATSATPAGSSPAPATVGTLSLTGQATGYREVANYVSALAAVPGLTGVTPATAATAPGSRGVTFTITASLTAAAQGGRYAPAKRATRPAAPAATGTAPQAGTEPANTAAAPPATAPSTAPARAQVGN